jgi:hypothetical protein
MTLETARAALLAAHAGHLLAGHLANTSSSRPASSRNSRRPNPDRERMPRSPRTVPVAGAGNTVTSPSRISTLRASGNSLSTLARARAARHQRHRVVVAGAREQAGRRVVHQQAAVGDDHRPVAQGLNLFEHVRRYDDDLVFADISRISVRTSCFWFGSRPSVGSSRISTCGSCMIACASPTRRLKPFDRVSIGCSVNRPGSAAPSRQPPSPPSAR